MQVILSIVFINIIYLSIILSQHNKKPAPHKHIALFAGKSFVRSGGYDDFVALFSDYKSARSSTMKFTKCRSGWVQIVDIDSGKILFETLNDSLN